MNDLTEILSTIFKETPIGTFSIIGAMCTSTRGIGFNGGLPWQRLPSDMKFFRTITLQQPVYRGKINNTTTQNALIMGRKTWDSIPNKPLKNRLNIVISRRRRSWVAPSNQAENVHVCENFNAALEFIKKSENIGNVFVIGGSEIFETAIKSDLCYRIYLTEIHKNFTCDVFFPEFDDVNTFRLIAVQHLHDNDVQYTIKCYTRNSPPLSSPVLSVEPKL